MSIFSQKFVCNFCFQISILLYTWCGKIFTLAVEEKPNRGIFYFLAVGGGSGLSEKFFFKNGCKWCILSPFLPSSCRFHPQNVCNFCLQCSDLHNAEDFFLSHGGSSRFFLLFFFLKNGYKWYILSPFIADCLLFFFLSEISLLSCKPRRAGYMYVMWEFTGDYMGEVGFFSCVGRIQGATQPPPNILKNWCNMHSETILADWTFVFYLKVILGGAIKGRRILMIRELLSCNFWEISTILKVQGTSREIILRLLFFCKLRARVSCIL